MLDSKIEWTDATWNPWTGCTRSHGQAPECAHCYASDQLRRFGRCPTEVRRAADRTFFAPCRWADGTRVFLGSLMDIADPAGDDWRPEAWGVIRATTRLRYLLLTKNPGRLAKVLPSDWPDGYDHVWVGTTVGHPDSLGRLDDLLAVPVRARQRFVSSEPLLADVDLSGHIGSAFDGMASQQEYQYNAGLGWVIAGGESGPQARPMHPAWARLLRDQAARAGLPFLFKQWGSWGVFADQPVDVLPPNVEVVTRSGRRWNRLAWDLEGRPWPWDDEPVLMIRRHKTQNGRLLDGIEHLAFPPELM